MEIATLPTQGEVSGLGGTGGGQAYNAPPNVLTWQDLLKLLSSGGKQQQQLPFAQLAQPAPPVPGQDVPVLNIPNTLPQQNKSGGDSTGAVLGVLAKMYGLGG